MTVPSDLPDNAYDNSQPVAAGSIASKHRTHPNTTVLRPVAAETSGTAQSPHSETDPPAVDSRERERADDRSIQVRFEQVVGRRIIELLAAGSAVLGERRKVIEKFAARRRGRRPMEHEYMALIQVALYLEGDCTGSKSSVLGRLARAGYVDQVPHPNTVANWRNFGGVEDGSEIGGPAMLDALNDLFGLTVEPACDFVREVVIDSITFTTAAAEGRSRTRKRRSSERLDGDPILFHSASCSETGLVAAFRASHVGVPFGLEAVMALVDAATANGVPANAEVMPVVGPSDAKRSAFQSQFVESPMHRLQDETDTRLLSKHVGHSLIEIYCKVIVHNLRRLIWLELERGQRIGVDRGDMLQS